MFNIQIVSAANSAGKFKTTSGSKLFLYLLQQHRLHARYVAGILKESISQLKRLPNLNLASTAISKQVTICGDLHGKLDDLLVIFHKVITI